MSEFARRILVLFAHPALQKSRVNRVLIEGLRDLEGVTLHDLYEAYPDFGIDVAREQRLLLENDLIVLQHPLFWYSTPAILKEWQDLVLEHGWAYGSDGEALAGKLWLNAITTGGREVAYAADGHNRFTIRELLRPLEQTARLCSMEFLPPYGVHGTLGMRTEEIQAHAAEYRRLLSAFRDGQVDLDSARTAERLNADLDSIIRRGEA